MGIIMRVLVDYSLIPDKTGFGYQLALFISPWKT